MEYSARVAAFAVLAITCVAARSVPKNIPDCPAPQPGVAIRITYYPNDEDCTQYWECDNGNLYNGTCPEGLVWNRNANSCDWQFNYVCTVGKKASPTSFSAKSEVSADSAGITCPGPNKDGSYNATFFSHKDDCSKYWRCDQGRLFEEKCAEGQVWIEKRNTCDWEFIYPCEKVPESESSWWLWSTVKRRTVVIPDSFKKAA